MPEIIVKVAEDFSTLLGGRFKDDGPYSGEEFRRKCLEPHFQPGMDNKVVVDFTGVRGYAGCFLEEAFGGLVRSCGAAQVKGRVEVRAAYNFLDLCNQIMDIIEDACEAEKEEA